MANPTIPIAFAAGFVSFLSPCVLPLVPGYLSYMSGMGAAEDSPPSARRTSLVALAFVLGFTIVFVALGASATFLGSLLLTNKTLLGRISGVIIIFFGLVFIGIIRVPFLYRDARFHPTPNAGVGGSLLLGGAFAFGWSPCIGATMGVVLTMAAGQASSGGPLEGAGLLAVYSLGLGVPFVLAGIGVSHVAGAVKWLRRHTRILNIASGLLLVVVGILFVTNQLFQVSIWMQRGFTAAHLDFWNAF
ncbi:MAG: cytochrome c biogenesis CcdA family protein [Actinomycetota bacterium]